MPSKKGATKMGAPVDPDHAWLSGSWGVQLRVELLWRGSRALIRVLLDYSTAGGGGGHQEERSRLSRSCMLSNVFGMRIYTIAKSEYSLHIVSLRACATTVTCDLLGGSRSLWWHDNSERIVTIKTDPCKCKNLIQGIAACCRI